MVYNKGMEKNLPRVTKMYKTPTWGGMDLYDLTKRQINDIRERILEAWERNFKETQVLEHAKITKEQYELILAKFPEFAAMEEGARMTMNKHARMNVAKSLSKGDVSTAKWFLEKTDPDFSPKLRSEAVVRVSVEEREAKIKEMMEKYETADFEVIEEDNEAEAMDGEGERSGLQPLQEDHDKQEKDDRTGEAGRD